MMHEQENIMTTNPSVMTVISLTKQEEQDNFSTGWLPQKKWWMTVEAQRWVGWSKNVQEGEKVRDAEREDQKQDAAPAIHDGDVV